jgi:hypothetical protein
MYRTIHDSARLHRLASASDRWLEEREGEGYSPSALAAVLRIFVMRNGFVR